MHRANRPAVPNVSLNNFTQTNISKCLQHTKVKVSCLRFWKVRELAEKIIITWKARRTKFVSARLTMSTKEDFARIAWNRRTRHHSRSDSSKSPSPRRRQPPRRSTNLPKFKIATFYATDVELWFNQIENSSIFIKSMTRYSLTCAALSGEVASDVRDVLLQPFRSHKYKSLKSILIERRGLTTPERLNKVISGEKMGSDIPSRFLRRLQKTAGFGTQAVVVKAVIRQVFIRQMPTSIRAHLATQPDIATLESLAMLADRALAEIKVDETTKLVGLLEDLSKRLKKLETATAAEKKRNTGRGRANNNYAPRPPFIPNSQATEFVPNKQSSFNNAKQNIRPYVPPQNAQRNNAANRIDTANAPVCYFHQTFGDKARTCRNPCAFSLKLLSQSKVATLASGGVTETRHDMFHSKLLYVADKNNKRKYLIETGAAVSVLPKSCANRISDADCLPLVAANNGRATTHYMGRFFDSL